jgi:hypothetical protein
MDMKHGMVYRAICSGTMKAITELMNLDVLAPRNSVTATFLVTDDKARSAAGTMRELKEG